MRIVYLKPDPKLCGRSCMLYRLWLILIQLSVKINDESEHAAKLAHQLRIGRFVSRGISVLLVNSSSEMWPVFDNLGVTKTYKA